MAQVDLSGCGGRNWGYRIADPRDAHRTGTFNPGIRFVNKARLPIIDHIIPLIDLYDNNFLIYNIKNDKFQILDISDDFIYDVDSIQKYMDNIK